jgi:hypothetical protein
MRSGAPALPDNGSRADIRMVADTHVAVARHARSERHEVADNAVVLNVRIKIRLKMRADTDVAGQRHERRDEGSLAYLNGIHANVRNAPNAYRANARSTAAGSNIFANARVSDCNGDFPTIRVNG